MNLNEIRQLLGMPKEQYSEEEVTAALKEYNNNNSIKIILVEE